MKKRLQERTFTLSLTIVGIMILSSVIYPSLFPTFDNLRQVLLNLSVETIVAVGMMLLMISGSFAYWRFPVSGLALSLLIGAFQ